MERTVLIVLFLAGVFSIKVAETTCAKKTTTGKCCVFPFIYKGAKYYQCTTRNHKQPWCSTTSNYDNDKQWGNCHAIYCAKRTRDSKCCVFPFIYKGHKYYQCTITDHNQPWCSITSNYDKDKLWGNCEAIYCAEKTKAGKFCVFPFIYKGSKYYQCTTGNHNKPWCSTTSNYDKDKQWGNCQAGKCCVFPFTYKGAKYYQCTTRDHNQPWCSTTSNYDKDKQWGNCHAIYCAKKTTAGKCCVFPFIYKGAKYYQCTTRDHNQPWCSTTSNYDNDKQWGNCHGD